ncbi:hypothetical protein KI387_011362 [Taxus chinensis]|uniref:Uncharacterized protein n=1 Tax=Taxus chinensis TaxID=29808 RepID=A0AA38FPA4_TAXCH|nr:hypothetical protein KI387_011362 [Taxus chinensis]
MVPQNAMIAGYAHNGFIVLMEFVCYPKHTDKPLYHGLITQLDVLAVPFLPPEDFPIELATDFDIIVDAIFGLSFCGCKQVKSIAKPAWNGGLMQKRRMARQKKKYVSRIKARYGDYECEEGPSIVDANMALLRKRMYDLQLQESCYTPPQEWMEWEINIRSDYYWNVCRLTGTLHACLMSTRPSLALAALCFLCMGVGTSVTTLLLAAWTNLHNLSY